MAQIPENPLLRLDAPTPDIRQTGQPRFIPSRSFTPGRQGRSDVGRKFARLGNVLDADRDPLELRNDPNGMAPERLLVFELTGDVAGFTRAAAGVPGLEFVGAEDVEPDETDKNPVLYLFIPDAAALRQMLSLWRNWLNNRDPPRGFAPWKAVFAHLRDLRPWGPRDRLTAEDLSVLAQEHADSDGNVRLELELVYRKQGESVEAAAREALQNVGGTVISRTRIEGAGYHALLVLVPEAELVRVRERGNEGLIAEESILHIRPQSLSQLNIFEVQEDVNVAAKALPVSNDSIAAIFDAVPLAGHPHLAGRLNVDDIFGLESSAAGLRLHGTAMASAVVHGDLNGPPQAPLDRRVYFVNVMYAPGTPGDPERFPDRLPADMFHEAIVRLKEGQNATAPNVIIVNASLGDRNKPFAGQMSGWARVLDYLSYRYGILFVVSAGNQFQVLRTAGMGVTEFEALSPKEKARTALTASGQTLANRRILSPAESLNALTVGALHADLHPVPGTLPTAIFDVWANTGLCNVSSALGLGYGGATKPDVIAPGGRHHVRLVPDGEGHSLKPLDINAVHFGGIRVAAPPVPPSPIQTARSIGTSVAAALLTGIATRAHEILEAAYDDFMQIPGPQRALLLKALMVHCAQWTQARDLIVDVLGPSDPMQNVRQKDNVRRYLGFGAVNGEMALHCAADAATMWAVGTLQRDRGHKFALPLPLSMSGKAQPHEIASTVSWFAPPKYGTIKYRGARLKLLDPEEIGALGVAAVRDQPDKNQSHRGTVIHRRWAGQKAAALVEDQTLQVLVQREPDEFDEPIHYAFVATLAMPGVNEIYTQVRTKLAIQPRVQVPA